MTDSIPADTPALRLGVYKLPAAETALVQTLLRLYASSGACRWIYAGAPPYDALLADGSTPEGQSHELDGMATVVLRLTRKSENTSRELLERPIRSDRFQQWLQSVERDLRRTAAPPGSASGARFRLLRWPPAAMLHDNAENIRLATLLSRRYLSARELAAISRQPEAACLEFIQALQSARLLRAEDGAAAPSLVQPASNAPQAQPQTQAPKRFFNIGLIQNIRKRLNF